MSYREGKVDGSWLHRTLVLCIDGKMDRCATDTLNRLRGTPEILKMTVVTASILMQSVKMYVKNFITFKTNWDWSKHIRNLRYSEEADNDNGRPHNDEVTPKTTTSGTKIIILVHLIQDLSAFINHYYC